jgi:Domain of unknown function (DUF1707)
MRVSDLERERALARLKWHYAVGTLNLTEFERRVEGIYQARTHRSVGAHLADLPLRGVRDLALRATRAAQGVLMRLHLSVYATVNLSALGIWIVVGPGAFWPAVLLIPSTAVLAWHVLLSRRLTRALARL